MTHGIKNVIRVENLLYKGCEPHWKCLRCGESTPFHSCTKEQFADQVCVTTKNIEFVLDNDNTPVRAEVSDDTSLAKLLKQCNKLKPGWHTLSILKDNI